MKRLFIPLLALVMLCLTGCTFLHREYSTVKPHSADYYESADQSDLRAESYQDLVNDLLILIDRRAETGTIHLYTAQLDMNADEALAAAMLETQYETPLGSYAVEFITHTGSEDATNHTVLEVAFGYRRTQQQLDQIIHATGVTALNTLLPAALENGNPELVLQVGHLGSRAELDEIITALRQEHAITDPWQVNCYPNDTEAGIVEILFAPEEVAETLSPTETE